MENLGALDRVLLETGALIQRTGARIPGFEAPVPFMLELNTLPRKQAILESTLRAYRQRRANPAVTGLGIAPLVVAGAGALVLGLSSVGAWIYSHFTDAKALDAQTKVYADMRADGTDPKSAARIVFGGNTDWGEVMSKMVLLSIIGAGVFLVIKFVK